MKEVKIEGILAYAVLGLVVVGSYTVTAGIVHGIEAVSSKTGREKIATNINNAYQVTKNKVTGLFARKPTVQTEVV